MGLIVWLEQARLLRSSTGNLAADMQNASRRETQAPPLTCFFRKELTTEGFEERKQEKPVNRPVLHRTSNAEDVTKIDSDLSDVFDNSVYSPKHAESSTCEHLRADCIASIEKRKDFFPSVSGKNSIEHIPAVPNIVIQHVYTSDTVSNQRAVQLISKTMHAELSVGLFSKKDRTHSDGAIYESEQKKQCFRSSHSFSSTPSNHLGFRNDSNIGPTVCDTTNRPLAPGCACESDRDGRTTSESLRGTPQFLQPVLWNLGGLDHFTIAQEKTPKLYWLRRHSDSNVANEGQEEDILQVDRHVAFRSQSISDTIPEIQHKVEHEESQVLHPGRVPCQKVKKYLQTRYQNQSIDSDDVFIDATDSRTKQTKPDLSVSIEQSKSSRTELISSSDKTSTPAPSTPTPSTPTPSTPAYSDSPIKLQQKYPVSDTVDGFSSVAGSLLGQFSHMDDDDDDNDDDDDDDGDDKGKEFPNDDVIPLVPVLPSRQTVFDFSFPTTYSVLRDFPGCSGNVVFGLLPQGCFSTPFLHSPLPSESFSLQSPSSAGGVPVSVVHGKEYFAVVSSPDSLSESHRWQSGMRDASGCSKRDSTKPDNSINGFAEPGCDVDKPACRSPYKICQFSSSNSSAGGLTCLFKNADKDTDIGLPSVTFGSITPSSSSATVVSSLPSLLTISSPLPSSPAVGTPTKSCPQVVFDYQFSERIHEQRQAGDNANFVCPVCGSIFLSYNSLANHVVSHLPSEVITQEGSESSKVHLCKVCNRSFSRSDMLSRHMRLHTGLRPYECHLCQQVFSRSDHLHTHLRTHTGEKPYRCSQCAYAAPRRDMVTRHMRIHARGVTRRGRRSSSTSSLASEVGRASDDNAVFEGASGRQTARKKLSLGRGKAGSLQKQRNWSLTSNDIRDCSEDRDSLKMTRTESTTSIDSGVSYLTPRSLVPSLWSPGVDSPDVFSRCPVQHFLWPATSSEIKHDLDKSVANFSSGDTDFEMHASFQKCQVASPLEQTFSVNSDELDNRRRDEDCI